MEKKIIIFIPHIRGGGVEKNFFIISNYLAKKIKNISVITVNKECKSKLDKKIKLISPESSKWKNSSIYIKYITKILNRNGRISSISIRMKESIFAL